MKKIFVLNNFRTNQKTIRVWWALIEEVASHIDASAMAAGVAGVLRLYFRFLP